MSAFLPPRPFRDTLALRVVVLWAVLRALGMAGVGATGGTVLMAPLVFFVGTPWIATVLVVAVWYDTERRGEAVFLANLGYGFGGLAVGVTAVVVVLDAAVAGALALVAGLR